MKTVVTLILFLTLAASITEAVRFELHTLERPADNLYVALRFDTQAGVLSRQKIGKTAGWIKLPALNPKVESKYQLATKLVGRSPIIMALDTKSGVVWIIGESGWEKVSSKIEDLPAGNYSLAIVEVKGSFEAFRINQATGETWKMKDDEWIKLSD